MNQTEKRRKRLLEQTRNLYSDNRSIPVVHPRYKAMYHHLYDDDYEVRRDTFGIRTGICVLLFLVYVAAKYSWATIPGIDNMQVLEIIMHNML